MEIDELKLRLVKELKNLIDVYFAENTFMDKMINSTLKVLIETNIDKIENFLNIFSKDGKIDAEQIINSYADQISDEGIKFNLKDIIQDEFLASMIPNKSLLIDKQDILKIIK